MARLALVYSDLQADDSTETLRSDPTTSLQRWRVRQFFADVLRLFKENNCQYLIDLGDTTDTRASISWPVLSEVATGLWAVNPNPLCSFKLIGNHEQVYRHTAETSAAFYWRHHFVSPDRAVIDLGKDKPVVVLAPYPADHGELAQWLADTAKRLLNRKTLLLGHFQVLGCKLNSGQSETGVPSSVVAGFTLSLLGHVHKPQKLDRGNAYYVGSPFQQNFGEANEKKRLCLLDLDTLWLEWLDLPSRYPVYNQVSVAEFEKLKDLGEDQLEVVLRDAAEAERFYAHPKCSQVKTSLLHFKAKETATAVSDTQLNLTPEGLLTSYAKEHPLQGFEQAELVEAGMALCR